MKTFLLNGNVWRVIRLMPNNPYLVDRDGVLRIGVADFANRIIGISAHVFPPLFDRVLLHEIGHAITMEYGLMVNEESAQLVENHTAEAILLATEILGRPLCVNGICVTAHNT